MGDYCGFQAQVKAPRQFLEGPLQDIIGCKFDGTFDLDPDGDFATWDGGDFRVGDSPDLVNEILELAREGYDGEIELPPWPIAFKLWEFPKYEYMGTLHIYVPQAGGIEPVYFHSECNAEGEVFVSSETLTHIVATSKDLVEAQTRMRSVLGETANAAWDAFEVTALPQQLEIEA